MPTTAADATEGTDSTRELEPDRRHRAVGGGDHVAEPAADPQPSVGVEVADVAGGVPARAAAMRENCVCQRRS